MAFVDRPVKTTQFRIGKIAAINDPDTVDRMIELDTGEQIQPTDFYGYNVGDTVFIFGTSNVNLIMPIGYKNAFSGTPRVIPVKIDGYGLGVL